MRSTNDSITINNKSAFKNSISKGVVINNTGVSLIEKLGMRRGVLLFKSIDSKEYETSWNRIKIESDIEKDSNIQIAYFASDKKEFVINNELIDIDEYLQSNIDIFEKSEKLNEVFKENIQNTNDSLMFNSKGRYLWIKVDLFGRHKAILKKLKIYYNSELYVKYLPEIYQSNDDQDFLTRYIYLYQSFFSDLEEKIEKMPRLFVPELQTGEFLRWISNWLCISNTNLWTEERLKKLINSAFLLYQKKGTKWAIKQISYLYTGKTPYIVEYFQYKNFLNSEGLGDVLRQIYGDNQYIFHLIFNFNDNVSKKDALALGKIIEEEIPANTEAKIIVLKPQMNLGEHIFVGMNTILIQYDNAKIDGSTALFYNSYLTE